MKAFTAILAVALVATMSAFAADFPEGSPAFEQKFEEALSKAKKENKPVVAIFSAVWCGPCQTMKRDVYPSATVKPYHDKFVWAYIDADVKSNQSAMQKFGVNGIPHIEFLDASGKSVGKQVGSTSPDSFGKILGDMLKKAEGGKTTSAGQGE